MRPLMASLAFLALIPDPARADFRWLGAWRFTTTLASSAPPSTSSMATTVDASASVTTAAAFASEDGTAPGFGENASVTIDFSRTFVLSGDSTPTTITLTGAATGTLSVTFPNPIFAGNGESYYSLQLGAAGQGGAPSTSAGRSSRPPRSRSRSAFSSSGGGFAFGVAAVPEAGASALPAAGVAVAGAASSVSLR